MPSTRPTGLPRSEATVPDVVSGSINTLTTPKGGPNGASFGPTSAPQSFGPFRHSAYKSERWITSPYTK